MSQKKPTAKTLLSLSSATPLPVSKKSIELLKQQARKLKRATPLTHSQALDVVAQEHGYKNWRQVNQYHICLLDIAKGICNGDLTDTQCAWSHHESSPCYRIPDKYLRNLPFPNDSDH